MPPTPGDLPDPGIKPMSPQGKFQELPKNKRKGFQGGDQN